MCKGYRGRIFVWSQLVWASFSTMCQCGELGSTEEPALDVRTIPRPRLHRTQKGESAEYGDTRVGVDFQPLVRSSFMCTAHCANGFVLVAGLQWSVEGVSSGRAANVLP